MCLPAGATSRSSCSTPKFIPIPAANAPKSTPRGAVAKFAAGGKRAAKKDLGLMAMSYGNIYVARVAMGAKDEHTLKAFLEAEAYDGPALIIAYSHCIAHGINMATAMQNQKAAVQLRPMAALSTTIPSARHRRKSAANRLAALHACTSAEYFGLENRFKMLERSKPRAAEAVVSGRRRRTFIARCQLYELLATRTLEHCHPIRYESLHHIISV